MPLQTILTQGQGQNPNQNPKIHTSLCRREASSFQQAIKGSDEVIVACTQEQRLFTSLAEQTEGAQAVIRFVNIRETAGWSAQAKAAGPKVRALLATAQLPEPEPVQTVSYKSTGRLLIIGPLSQSEALADALGTELQISLFNTTHSRGMQERRYPVLTGKIDALQGWLGAFELRWSHTNPIDLDLCTRCNACIAACPEQAIGLDYQIDLSRCQSHRACITACGGAAAIDFERAPQDMTDTFDLVLDLRTEPAFSQHAKPQGYFHNTVPDAALLLKLQSMMGEFDKPKFFHYQQKLCAHSRNEQVGCRACIDVCSALAISSDASHQKIMVNPSLCVGCGACTTVCPSGALSYVYPRVPDQARRIKTLLKTYGEAGADKPILLLHSQTRGQAAIEQLGRNAQLRRAQGIPANVIPLSVWHSASIGLDVMMAAIAYGACGVAVLVSDDEDAPQYLTALREQMAVGQALLSGLGYAGQHLHLLQTNDLDAALQALAPAQSVTTAARFNAATEKRSTLHMALEHLLEYAPTAPIAPIALPTSSPLGNLLVDKDRCTLCLACINACPASALSDNAALPQLRFTEKNCLQCGLCAATCPEQALQLEPRWLTTPERTQPRILNESPPYACIRCSKPFGTLKAIEAMLGKLSTHSMFQGAAIERLKMCGDCRVIDIHTNAHETRITDL